jgi:cysteine sulfinate desulfinase/cysteine desulfurase-like protein
MAGNSNQIYFDHAATTPMVQPAITALTNQILKTGNASSSAQHRSFSFAKS